MDVLILAAGLSSRLSKFTHELLPKYLIDIDGNNGLYYLIKYWDKYSKNIFLVIHSKYNLITISYIKNMLDKYVDKIKIINYDSSDGTAYTLNKILNNELSNYIIKNLLITWCDIYPLDDLNFMKTIKQSRERNNIHIFTCGNECRFNLDNENNIIESKEGNIIGIYYFQNYKKIHLDEKETYGKDIIHFLKDMGKINNYKINNIFDYGDEEKLLKILSDNQNNDLNKIKCRYFNEFQIINGDKLFKKSNNDKGRDIIMLEKNWYSYIQNLDNKKSVEYLFPKIYEIFEYGFLMEYKKNYIPVYQYFIKNNDYNIQKNILNKIMFAIDNIHQLDTKIIDKVEFYYNLKKEIYDKLYNRKLIINDYINYFSNIHIVNDIEIDSFDNIVNKCNQIILEYYQSLDILEYSVILGDAQFSNILIDPENISNITFIDPRGYFGNSKIYGPKEYDYAKILYAITGYDSFNNNYFNLKNINLDNGTIDFEINGIYFDKDTLIKYFNKVHEAFVVLIWLSLPEYNKNNIWKCIGSYYYGLYLGTLL